MKNSQSVKTTADEGVKNQKVLEKPKLPEETKTKPVPPKKRAAPPTAKQDSNAKKK
jgi:hypothetical protein